jgi:hypothetical protein
VAPSTISDMRPVVAWLLVVAAGAAFASDYPTDPSEMDKLCEEMGSARDASAPAKDRLWFSESCLCEEEIGCGRASSRRFAERRKVAAQAETRLLETDQKARAARDAEARKQAQATCASYVECLRKHPTDLQACGPAEATFEYDCSSGLRDFEACGQAIDGFKKSPAAADCGGALNVPKP